MDDSYELEILYTEICRGYSTIKVDMNGRFQTYYFRHPDYVELFDLEQQKNLYIEEGKESGLLSYDDTFKLLDEEGWWTKEQENQLNSLQSHLHNLRTTHRKIHFAQREGIEIEIQKQERIVAELLYKKNDIFPRTLESFITEKIYDLSIINFFYSDKKLTNPLFNEDTYYDSDDDVISIFHNEYSKLAYKFSPSKIRRLSSSTFFQNLLYVGGEFCDSFFGKPVVELSNYQYQLLLSGKNFKTIIYNCAQIDKPIPSEQMGDPDQMENWYNNKLKEYKNPKDSQKNKNYASRFEEAKRAGGKVDMNSSLKNKS